MADEVEPTRTPSGCGHFLCRQRRVLVHRLYVMADIAVRVVL
jgi:hypothetical protein